MSISRFPSLLLECPGIPADGSASPSRLLSLVRLSLSLGRLRSMGVIPGMPVGAQCSPPGCGGLFLSVVRRLEWGGDSLGLRARLTDALYALSREGCSCYDASVAGLCEGFVRRLMSDYGDSREGFPAPASLCRVLESYFYPGPWEEDAWFVLLRSTLAHWCRSLSGRSVWAGLPLEEGWFRLEVLNRYSYLFRDGRYDADIIRASRSYASLMCDSPLPLEVWGSYVEAVSEGHLLHASDKMLEEAQKCFVACADKAFYGSDQHLYSLSYKYYSLLYQSTMSMLTAN